MDFGFEWDAAKARANARKHHVTFEEAVSVFADPFLMTFPDTEHSELEERLISIGQSDRGRLLLIIHTERAEAIRLISCRKATTTERRIYEQ